MNIFGEGFPKEIIDQVNIRQKVHGYGYFNNQRNNDYYVYTNANTSWCKLVSATEILNNNLLNNTLIKQLSNNGVNITSDNLAKNFILFNGTSRSNTPDGKAGFNYTQSPSELHNKAYNSIGPSIPDADFGFRPMAGIQSVKVKHKNRGSIRTADVEIKAWDKVSFEIIDVLYLRLGFSILLEWGHSMYFDNTETLQTNVDLSLAGDFLNGTLTYSKFLEKIQDQRIYSEGNYDAMFAKVTNFNWKYNKDGSYDITLNLISIGDVVESFKVKGNGFNEKTVTDVTGSLIKIDIESSWISDVLDAYANTSDIAKYLYKAAKIIDNQTTPPFQAFIYNYNQNTDPATYWSTHSSITSNGCNKDIVRVEAATSSLYATESVNTSTGFVNTVYVPEFESFRDYYIRLGNLLDFIEDGIMYKVKGKNTSTQESILHFDTKCKNNLMHIPPQIMSYNPKICMVRRFVEHPGVISPAREYFNQTGVVRSDGFVASPTLAKDFADPFDAYLASKDKGSVGKIMNIYINFRFILIKLKELTDKDTNEIKLIDFLREILSGVNSAFSGYSKLDLFIDETNNNIKIIDQNPLPSIDSALTYVGSNLKDVALFNLTGYSVYPGQNYGQSSFINAFKFTTEITPEFSTMITVAATSNGSAVGENNTALSKINLGLRDKYKEFINNGSKSVNSTDNDKLAELNQNVTITKQEYEDFVSKYKNFLDHLFDGIFNPNEIEDNKESFTVYNRVWKKYNKALQDLEDYYYRNGSSSGKPRFQPGTGFIPFNLSLTFDGMSGVKIGNKFLVNTSYLPSNYPETVDFLIKNIVHEIKDNKWTTTLESFCISQGDNSISAIPVTVTPTPTPTPTPSSTPTPTSTNLCGKANASTVNTVYPKSVKWGGSQAVITPPKTTPTVTINLSTQPIVSFVRTEATYDEVITAAKTLIEKIIPTAPLAKKKLILIATLATAIKEQGSGGKIRGFNNNLTGVESSGFKVFSATDVNGKVKAREGGTGLYKFYYSFSSLDVGLIPLVSKIIDRNMFAQDGEANQWAWRWFRDWNGYGGRTVPDYKSGKINDCDIIKGAERVYEKALNAVNASSAY